MKKRTVIAALLVVPVLLFAIKSARTNMPALISRKTFFGNPEKVNAVLSPNGQSIAYLAPLVKNDEKQVLNIWIRSIDKKDDLPLTNDTDRSIADFFFAHDGSQILYIKDTKGDENWRLYGIDLVTKTVTCYTPFEKVQARVLAHNKQNPTTILLGLNKDDPKLHDVYSLDLKTGKLTFVLKNPGNVAQYAIDSQLKVQGMLQELPTGGKQFLARKNDGWEPIRVYECEDSQNTCFILGFCDKDNSAYILEAKESNTSRIVALNCTTGKITVIAHDDDYDMSSASINPDTHEVEAVCCQKEKEEWRILKQGNFAKVLKAFEGMGNIHVESEDDSSNLWTVMTEKDTDCAVYYLYDAQKNTKKELFKARPDLPVKALSPMESIKFTSRDGLTIHGYITYPRGIPRTNLPMVLFVHGGPWSRDKWHYNSQVQWLANRGYAVMQINYRGSTGYGKKFVSAANKEWGGKMHDDLIDGIDWAVKSGTIDPKKIAIMGGSYGGYAALVGATFTPDVFCCAVDYVGPSNLITFLKSTPAYWELWRAKNNKAIGNPETEQEFLRSRSPLFKADTIKIPLLIAQGAHDPRVNAAESEQIVAALKKHGIPHEYLLFPDEGHGFIKAENRLKVFAATETFLARYLGGRCEA